MNQNYLYDVIWKAICCMNGFMKYEELLYSESAVEVKCKEKLIINICICNMNLSCGTLL